MSQWFHPKLQVNIVYDESGSLEGSLPLVLIHGYPMSSKLWSGQLAAFGSRRKVIAVNIFGFGGSAIPENGWNVDSMADALADLLSGIGITAKAIVGGLSMGGYIALAFARRHSDRLAALLLCDSRAEADSPETRASRDQAMATAREQGARAIIDAMLPKILGATTHAQRPEVVTSLREMGASQTVPAITAALAALRDRPDATPGLADIKVPTLVIVGSEDLLTPPELSRQMAAKIPGAKLEVIQNSGHVTNLETPEEFNKLVGDWLQEIG